MALWLTLILALLPLALTGLLAYQAWLKERTIMLLIRQLSFKLELPFPGIANPAQRAAPEPPRVHKMSVPVPSGPWRGPGAPGTPATKESSK